MKKFRLIRSGVLLAVENMALDGEIFDHFLKDGIPVFRVYRWQTPSFTYGVSQHPESELDVTACLRDGVGIAKRITGGGVLFHDQDLTYSFACSKFDVGEPKDALVSYRQICAFLINFYSSLGLKADFALNLGDFQKRSAPHELCSASFEKYDITVNGRKIGGNAQKRKRESILQHGSIPLSIDWDSVRRYAPSLPPNIADSVTTLSQELADLPDTGVLEEKLIESFGRTFGVEFMEQENLSYETSMA